MYPHIRGKELGDVSQNAADSQPGVSRYDQKPWVGVRRGRFVNELVKGCHTKPFWLLVCRVIRFYLARLIIDSNRWLLISYEQWLSSSAVFASNIYGTMMRLGCGKMILLIMMMTKLLMIQVLMLLMIMICLLVSLILFSIVEPLS